MLNIKIINEKVLNKEIIVHLIIGKANSLFSDLLNHNINKFIINHHIKLLKTQFPSVSVAAILCEIRIKKKTKSLHFFFVLIISQFFYAQLIIAFLIC
jgi:hypothetical protein